VPDVREGRINAPVANTHTHTDVSEPINLHLDAVWSTEGFTSWSTLVTALEGSPKFSCLSAIRRGHHAMPHQYDRAG